MEAEANQPEDLHEISVTRKLGHTDIGDISDILEVGSALNKSQEGTDIYQSRIEIPGQHSMIHIKRMDYSRDSIDVNRDDISDRSHAPAQPQLQVNLSSSFAAPKGIINTSASAHLKEAMAEVKRRVRKQEVSQHGEFQLPRHESDNNSLEAASKIAVVKHPVSLIDFKTGAYNLVYFVYTRCHIT